MTTTKLFAITNRDGNTVSFIDADTRSVITSLPGGTNPRPIAYSNGNFAWGNMADNTVQFVSSSTLSFVGTTLAVGQLPYGAAASPSYFYFSNGNDNTVSFIDTTTLTVTGTAATDTGPRGIAYDPDNNQIAVACYDSGKVTFINATTRAVLGSCNVGVNPNGICYGNGYFVVVNEAQDSGTPSASIIVASTRTVTSTITLGSGTAIDPYDAAYDPDHNHFGVTLSGDNQLAIIDGTTLQLSGTRIDTSGAAAYRVGYGNGYFVIGNSDSNNATFIDASSLTWVENVATGVKAYGVAYAYVPGGVSTPPIVSGNTAGNASGTADVTTLNVNIGSPTAGERVVVAITKRGTAAWTGTPSGWTILDNNRTNGTTNSTTLLYKDCTGSEGATISFTVASGISFAAKSWRIQAGTFDTSTAPEFSYHQVTTAATNNNPAAVTPSWGSANDLFLCWVGCNGNATVTGSPSGYSAIASVRSTTTTTANRQACGYCYRTAVGSSEDPGAFTNSSSISNAYVIAVKPYVAPSGSVGSAAGTSTSAGVGSSQANSVGSSAGTSTTSGIGSSLAQGVGSAEGTSTAPGVGSTGGTIAQGAGSSSGTSTAGAVGSSVANSIGTSTGTSTSSGTGSSLASSIGTSAGTSTSSGVGGSLAQGVGSAAGTSTSSGTGSSIASGVGTSSVTSTSSGVGVASFFSAGTSAGTSTTLATGAAIAQAVGSAPGLGTASATGVQAVQSVASAIGLSTCLGVGGSLFVGTGTSSGTSTSSGIGGSLFQGIGSAAGTSTALAVPVLPSGQGTGTSTGTSTASGVGSSLAGSIGTSAGTSTASGVGSSQANSVGSSAGTSTTSGIGSSLAKASGSAAGTSTALGVSVPPSGQGTGTSAGTSSANAIGKSLNSSIGTSSGTSTASGIGGSLAKASGSVTGTSTAQAVGLGVEITAGISTGTSTVFGIGSSLFASTGTAAGTSTAEAFSSTIARGVGSAAGTSTASGTSLLDFRGKFTSKLNRRINLLTLGANMLYFTISPGESDYWQVDCNDLLNNEGDGVSITSVAVQVEKGQVVLTYTQHVYGIVTLHANAATSPLGDKTSVKLTLTLSNGEVVPRWVQFKTRKQ